MSNSDPTSKPTGARAPFDPRASMFVMVLIFAALAFLVPDTWIKSFNTMIEPDRVETSVVFKVSTAELDDALGKDSISETERDALKSAREAIQVRRLSDAGPMTSEEVSNALTTLRAGNLQVDREPSLASREAMRREISRRAARELPRFKPEDVVRVLDTFDAQYMSAMGIALK